jgi:very-short-patch-repair endonuclease
MDFFCHDAALNVELDGRQHGFPSQQQHDAERGMMAFRRGFKRE